MSLASVPRPRLWHGAELQLGQKKKAVTADKQILLKRNNNWTYMLKGRIFRNWYILNESYQDINYRRCSCD